MDIFNQKLNNDQINTLKELCDKQSIIGYSDLCRKLGMEVIRGNKKLAQLKDIREYCDLEEIQVGNSKITKYRVNEIYPKAIIELNGLLNTNKFQLFFEAIIYNKLLDQIKDKSKSDYLYLSNTELLEICHEVNDNFHYLLNYDYMAENYPDKLYMAEMAPIIHKILVQWTRRRIEKMEARGIIDIEKGYRLYKKQEFRNKDNQLIEYYTYENVIEPNKQAKVREINARAIYDTIPDKFFEEKDNKEVHLAYLPGDLFQAYKNRLHELLHEAYPYENYTDLKRILVIKPPTDNFLFFLLEKIYGELVKLGVDVINNEACRKILHTSQLNNYKNEQRAEFIDTNIKLLPEISFRRN